MMKKMAPRISKTLHQNLFQSTQPKKKILI